MNFAFMYAVFYQGFSMSTTQLVGIKLVYSISQLHSDIKAVFPSNTRFLFYKQHFYKQR